MNTTEKGNKFEEKVINLLMKEIEGFNTFINPKNHIEVFTKKKYYSDNREGYIEFDIVIEVYQKQDIKNLSQIIIIECKDYAGTVGVDQVNKFLGDIDDIRESQFRYGIKPFMAISSRLAKGAFNIVKNKNVGLIKVNEADELKWVFNRSFKYQGVNQNLDLENIFIDELLPDNHGTNWFIYAEKKWFNSFENYLFFLTGHTCPSFTVKYYSKDDLEVFAGNLLKEVNYAGKDVSLSNMCRHPRLNHITVREDVIPNKHEEELLGRVDFEKNEIFVYKKDIDNEKRDRFTLAHEIAHILLEHHNYLSKDTLDEKDVGSLKPINDSLVVKLEFQANYLASCLLLPKEQFLRTFSTIYRESGIKRRGKFWIYLDNQPENKIRANNVINKLSRYFNVSKSVIKIRLIDFGLLHED